MASDRAKKAVQDSLTKTVDDLTQTLARAVLAIAQEKRKVVRKLSDRQAEQIEAEAVRTIANTLQMIRRTVEIALADAVKLAARQVKTSREASGKHVAKKKALHG